MDDSTKSPEGVPERVERAEHSIMEGLPAAKAERVAAMRRELADMQRQLSEAQQRIASETQARAEDDERMEALEERLKAAEAKGLQLAALETEIEGRRQLISKLSATTEDLRRDLVARDAQLEEARNQYASLTQQLEAQRASFEEAKKDHTARDTEVANLTSERDSARAQATRLEKELEEERKKHGALTDEIAGHSTVAAERDALKLELEKAHAELEAGKAKAKDFAAQFTKLGQDLAEAGVLIARPHPPPLPPRRDSAAITIPKVEEILEVKVEPDEAKKPKVGSTLLMIVSGLVLGSIITLAIVHSTSSSSASTTATQASQQTPSTMAAPTPTEQPAPQLEAANTPTPTPTETPAAATAPVVLPPSNPPSAAQPTTPATADAKADGTLVLPEEAAGHRLFVDGKNVEFTGARATVPCGKHDIRIGSHGNTHSLDIACGAETTVPKPL